MFAKYAVILRVVGMNCTQDGAVVERVKTTAFWPAGRLLPTTALIHPAPLRLDAMVQTWPRLRLYAFPPIALLPGVLPRVRRDEVSLLLVAPFWPGRVWFSDNLAIRPTTPLFVGNQWVDTP